MTYAQELSMLSLSQHTLLSLPDARGKSLAVFSGQVWITEDGDLEDKVLGPGESIVLRRPGLALVEAIKPSQVMLFDGAAWAAPFASATPAASAQPTTPAQIGPASAVMPSREQIERQARELRRQAIQAALDALADQISRLAAVLRTAWCALLPGRRQQAHCN